MGFLRFIGAQIEDGNFIAFLAAAITAFALFIVWLFAIGSANEAGSVLGFFAALTSPAALVLLVLWLQCKSRGTDE